MTTTSGQSCVWRLSDRLWNRVNFRSIRTIVPVPVEIASGGAEWRVIVGLVFVAGLRAIKIIASCVLVGAAAVLLAFPELVPAEHRTLAVTWLTAAALVAGVYHCKADGKIRLGLALFAVAVMAGWWITPERDPVALRHFSGIGLGVMTTGLIAAWCTSERRLITAAILFSLAATGVLLRGSVSAFNSSLAPPASKLLAPEFVVVPLNIPGTELSDGHVNTNALGGTAVLVLPVCVALAVTATMIASRRRSILSFVAGSGAGLIAAAVVLMTVSRSALGAAAFTIVTLALRWRGGRRWLLLALLLAGGSLAYGTLTWRKAAPEEFDRRLSDSVAIRSAILQDGLNRLKESPWLGIGISQFRSGPRTSLIGDDQVAHVHNIYLQVALDVGLVGLMGYMLTFGLVLVMAHRTAMHANVAGRIAAGAGLSLVAVHIFGLADAIALGAKVGVFQWWSAGLVLAAFRLSTRMSRTRADAG